MLQTILYWTLIASVLKVNNSVVNGNACVIKYYFQFNLLTMFNAILGVISEPNLMCEYLIVINLIKNVNRLTALYI